MQNQNQTFNECSEMLAAINEEPMAYQAGFTSKKIILIDHLFTRNP
jgi:hypothetical protein